MANIEVALDLGSYYVTAASKATNFIVKEPSLVAVDPLNKSIKAAGLAAVKLYKSPLSKVTLVPPFVDGAVADKEGAKLLVKGVLAKVLPKNSLFSRTVVICAVPCALPKTEKQKIEYILNMLSVKQVRFVEAPLAAAVEIYRQFNVDKGVVCDMGADKTDIAVLSGSAILGGCTLYYGGRSIDKEIIDFVNAKYNVLLGGDEAEKVKRKAGSLYPNDLSSAETQGMNTVRGVLETIEVTARELYDLISGAVSKYAEVVENLLSSLPAGAAQEIRSQGVFLCGGLTGLSGIDKFFLEALQMNVRIPASPDNVNIKGALALF